MSILSPLSPSQQTFYFILFLLLLIPDFIFRASRDPGISEGAAVDPASFIPPLECLGKRGDTQDGELARPTRSHVQKRSDWQCILTLIGAYRISMRISSTAYLAPGPAQQVLDICPLLPCL